MTRKLGVGILGVGGISRAHMPGWAASEHAEVIAGSDISEENLANWGQEFGVTRLSADPADLFRDPAIDIIDICTPNMFHAELAIARSEEHTSELQSRGHLVCRLLLEN